MLNLSQIFETCSPLLATDNPIQFIHTKITFVDTPLHLMSGQGDLESVLTLIYNGADINAQGDKGLTPIYRAISAESVELVELFIGLGANLNIQNSLSSTPLEYALAIKPSTKIIEILSNPKIIKKIKLDLNNYRPEYRLTHAKNLSEVLKACASNYLYNQNVSTNTKDILSKATPLHLMSAWGDLQAVYILIKNGAKLNAIDMHGNTALFYSVLGQNAEIADALLNAGPNYKIVNADKLNLLEFLLFAFDNEKITNEFLSVFVRHNLKFSKLSFEKCIKQDNTMRLINRLTI